MWILSAHRSLNRRTTMLTTTSFWQEFSRICLICHSLNLSNSRFNVGLKGYLKLLDDPNDRVRIIL